MNGCDKGGLSEYAEVLSVESNRCLYVYVWRSCVEDEEFVEKDECLNQTKSSFLAHWEGIKIS
jgi:hypothetical protein